MSRSASPGCPRCGYDLRGELSRWHERCPLRGRCTECGLALDWSRVLRPDRYEPRWCVEHGRPSWRVPLAAAGTALRGLLPRRFWSTLEMSHPMRPRRLVAYLLLLTMLPVLAYMVEQTAVALVVRSRLDRLYPGIRVIQPAVPPVVAEAVLRPFAPSSRITLKTAPVPGVRVGPYPPPRMLHLISVRTAGRYRLREVASRVMTPLLWWTAVLALMPLLFVLLPVSRRRARVRWAHLWRIAAYGWHGPMLILTAVVLLVAVAFTVPVLHTAAIGAVFLLPRWLTGPWLVVWWAAAIGRYLRMPHAWPVSIVFAFLACLLVYGTLMLVASSFATGMLVPLVDGRQAGRGCYHVPTMTSTSTTAADLNLDRLSLSLLELLDTSDPDVARILRDEAVRQATTLELIASENHVSPAVMHAMGSWMTNKYAEGYPGKRYYGGCGYYDEVENLARDRAKQLFGCGFANVQPHSGASANIAAFMALCKPGDTIMSLPIKSGGHLSHGLKVNFAGTFYSIVDYDLDAGTELLDYDEIARIAAECKPRMIICGYSAYPRTIDFARFREIADSVGAFLMADIAHIAGLVAAGVHPSPFPHAHVVTTTTHKTLRGPRGGLVLSDDEEIAKKVDRRVFPGSQGGPLMHMVAAKAVAFGEALKPAFTEYSRQIVANAAALADALAGHGYRLCSGGTDNHLMLVDLRQRDENLTGQDAEQWLESAGIVVNKNGIPNDPRPPMVTSGLRLGTPALTTRGMTEPQMREVAALLDRVMGGSGDPGVCAAVREDVRSLCAAFPLPH
ncbi:MAG: serine hydroxymethyltransferase [Planctomycetota bacterium]|jgi:glycine hydroxymethyltransferase